MAEYCNEHCMMMDHLREAPKIREMVHENTTKFKNYDKWIPKIEGKVDEIPAILNSFYIRIMLSLGILNLGTMIVMKFLK
jgi:hypothetical protein